MAVRCAIGTGNFTTAGTWGLVDNTSYLNAENILESPLTTAYSGTRSSAFTPGAITISHIGVKLCERVGTTGTMSVSLRNATIGLDDFVTGTEVTINVSDLPAATETGLNGGWVLLKLSAPVTLLAATNYNIQAKTSSTSQVDLWCDSTLDNLSRILVTTTTGAPAAGDDFIITKEWTAAGTGTDFDVTMDNVDNTDYGSASTSLVTPALAICNGGTLTFGSTAATNYQLRLSGNAVVYAGGTLNVHTVASPCPEDSTSDFWFDCATNVDFGLVVRNLGTCVGQGFEEDEYLCYLNTDEAIASTSLGVDRATSWKDNYEIAVASTTRTTGNSEVGALNGNAGASSLTVDGFAGAGGGLAVAHSGTSPTQAEVILLTRNVRIRGASATLQAFIVIEATATVDFDWVEFKWLGSNTTNKRGINLNTTTGISSFQYCSFRDFVVTGSGAIIAATNAGGFTISNNVFWNITTTSIQLSGSTLSNWIIDSNIFISGGLTVVSLTDVGGTFTNNIIVGGQTGINIAENGVIGTFANNTAHSQSSNGLFISSQVIGTISNTLIWRTNGNGISIFGGDFIIDGLTAFGCSASTIVTNGAFTATIINLISNGDTTFSTTSGIVFGGGNTGQILKLFNADFSTVTGIKTAHTNDISCSNTASVCDIRLNNSKLGGTNEVFSQNNIPPSGSISSQKHDQTNDNHKWWGRYGTGSLDSAIFRTAAPSERLTPINASFKFQSGIRQVAVANGQTLTPSVYVRESVVGDGTDYNGNRIRLFVKRNDAIGISADTLLATATVSSVGAFEELTGTTIAATDEGVMEFYVDCDGTTGWVNIDDWTVS